MSRPVWVDALGAFFVAVITAAVWTFFLWIVS